MKRAALVALLAVVLVPLASAGSIDILFAGGTWSWPGGVGSQLTANSTSVLINTSTLALPINITSGPAIGGDGSVATPYTWGAGGSVVFFPGGCTAGADCIDGVFTSAQFGTNGFGGMTFVGNFISGTVDPQLLSFLGLPLSPTGYIGLIHFDVNPVPASFAAGGSGFVGSGDLHLVPVPEPGTLALFGSGLIGIAGLLRRKFNL